MNETVIKIENINHLKIIFKSLLASPNLQRFKKNYFKEIIYIFFIDNVYTGFTTEDAIRVDDVVITSSNYIKKLRSKKLKKIINGK